jgi:hypothetical protein
MALSYPVRMVVGIDQSPGGFMGRASNRADIPDCGAITAGPAQWNVAARALALAVVSHLTRGLAGDTPGDAELAVLSRALDGTIPGVAGSVVADALSEAVNPRYLRDVPGQNEAAPTSRQAA